MGPLVGGQIAGVASTADAEGIMLYNDRSNYGEWEFIFDPQKVKPLFNPLAGAAGTPAAQMGSMGGSPPGVPVGGMQPGQQQQQQGLGGSPMVNPGGANPRR
jgi:hypothetical protein